MLNVGEHAWSPEAVAPLYPSLIWLGSVAISDPPHLSALTWCSDTQPAGSPDVSCDWSKTNPSPPPTSWRAMCWQDLHQGPTTSPGLLWQTLTRNDGAWVCYSFLGFNKSKKRGFALIWGAWSFLSQVAGENYGSVRKTELLSSWFAK